MVDNTLLALTVMVPVPALITRCARGPCRLHAQTGGPASADCKTGVSCAQVDGEEAAMRERGEGNR